MKFRKKPVVIEALQLTHRNVRECIDFIGEEHIPGYGLGEFQEDDVWIEITTLEGVVTARESDFIIKGVKGEFYPCKPDIFEQTYERIEE